MLAKFPQFSFAECPEEWDYPPFSTKDAIARAEVVRQRLKELLKRYANIALMTNRRFIAFLLKVIDLMLVKLGHIDLARIRRQRWRL